MVDFDHIARCELPIAEHPAGERWFRIHRLTYDALFFGPVDGHPPTGRFDDPSGRFRVCYVGVSPFAAVAETLLHSPRRRILGMTDVRARALATIALERTVRLVALHGPGLNMLDITADFVDGDYSVCGQLARALFERSKAFDGVEYRSRHDNGELAVALFDRASDALRLEASVPLEDERRFIVEVVERYRISLS